MINIGIIGLHDLGLHDHMVTWSHGYMIFESGNV